MMQDFDKRLTAAQIWPPKRGELYFKRQEWSAGRWVNRIFVVPRDYDGNTPIIDGAEVYGILGDSLACGWLKEGPWIEDAERVVGEIEREREEERERREREEREREAAREERMRALLDNYGKTPHPAHNR